MNKMLKKYGDKKAKQAAKAVRKGLGKTTNKKKTKSIIKLLKLGVPSQVVCEVLEVPLEFVQKLENSIKV